LGKIALIVLRSEDPYLDQVETTVLERELSTIRLPRYWNLEKITILDI